MDNVLQSNLESAILTGLSTNFTTDLGYRLEANYPNLSKQLVVVPPNVAPASGAPWSTTVIFSLPRSGIMTDLFINTNFTMSATTGSAAGPVFVNDYDCGLSLFESVELRARNRIICSNHDCYIRARVYNAPTEKALFYKRMSKIQPLNSVAAITSTATVMNVWTPIFFSFMESVREGLDLTFVENLQLYCNWNTSVRAGWGAATYSGAGNLPTAVTIADPANVNMNLYMRYYNLTNSEWAKLKSENFRRDSPSQFLIYDNVMESPYVNLSQSANTTISINLTVNNCVTATHILTVFNTAGGCALIPGDCATPGYIDAVGFKLQGKFVWQSISTIGLDKERHKFGASDLTYGTSPSVGGNGGYIPVMLKNNSHISIFWGLDPSHSYNSGAVSLHSRNAPTLYLTQNLNPTTATTIYIVHEVLSIMSVDGLSSAITVSTGL